MKNITLIMSRIFPYPCEDEIRHDYRLNYSIMPHMCYTSFFQFHGPFYSIQENDKKNGIEKFTHVLLVQDVNCKNVEFDGIRTVKFPTSSHLTYEIMFGIAKLGKILVYSINLMCDNEFILVIQEHGWRFHDVYIHNPGHLDPDEMGFKKLFKKFKVKKFDKRFKAHSVDVEKEFKNRLEFYYGGIGYGIGFSVCIVTCAIGVPLFVFSVLALACDSSITGIRYLYLKKQEKNKL